MLTVFLSTIVLISITSAETPLSSSNNGISVKSLLEVSQDDDETSDSAPSDKCQQNTSRGYIEYPKDEKVHPFLPEWWYWAGQIFTEDGTHYLGQWVFLKYHVGEVPTVETSFILYSPDKNHILSLTKDQEIDEVDGQIYLDYGDAQAYNHDDIYSVYGKVDEFTLNLDFTPVKAPFIFYEDGRTEFHFGGYLDYYSNPRNDVTGTLQIGDQVHQVTGYGYYEHAYGQIGALLKIGWDWFEVNLDDGSDIMIAIIRMNYYVWVYDKDCNDKTYRRNQFKFEVLRTWQSSRTKCQYATAWKLTIEDKEYIIEAIRDDMEFLEKPAIKYAAALKVSGSASGRGIMENMGICSY